MILAVRRLEDLAPRFIEMDRISPMTFRSVDVGVVLDMMIHDLDLLLMLLGIQVLTTGLIGEMITFKNFRRVDTYSVKEKVE